MIKEIEAKDWDKEVMRMEEKPVVVEFSGSHCVWCKRLEPIYEQLSNEYTAIKLLRFVIDKNEDNMNMALKYAVDSTPTLKIFYRGAVLGELIGFEEKEFLRAEIEHVIRRKDAISNRSTRAGQAGERSGTAAESKRAQTQKYPTLSGYTGVKTSAAEKPNNSGTAPAKEKARKNGTEESDSAGLESMEKDDDDSLGIESMEKP